MYKPLDVHQDSSTLTLDVVPLEDDESSVEGAVLEGSAEPLCELFEHVAVSHGTRASADAGPVFPEEAWVPVDVDPGPPEMLIPD